MMKHKELKAAVASKLALYGIGNGAERIHGFGRGS
jgi:hypothetical protein